MSALFYIGLGLTLAVIVGLAIWTGAHAARGRRTLSTPLVAGAIMGTLVGGSSTVGTAQLAFQFGFSAWWFTLGSGIACLILALTLVVPLRRTGCATLVWILRKEYGEATGMVVSVLSAAGIFINIISQMISATAVLAVIWPVLGTEAAVVITVIFMVLYVIFGGTKGTGVVGIMKMSLLYLSMILCGIMILHLTGGISGWVDAVNSIPDQTRFFSLFARGFGVDSGACLSLILGVLTTQTYAQAVLWGKSDKASVTGAVASAFLVPPIGVGGILVGLYMRANQALYPGLTAKTALTTFVTAHMPPLVAGVILGALFVTVVGGGSGLALGIATIVQNDIVPRLYPGSLTSAGKDRLTKLWIALVLVAAGCLSCGALGDTILQFAFMSMGLRGAVVFAPLLFAMCFPGRVRSAYPIAAAITGSLLVFVFGIWKVLPIDSLFLGTGAALLIMLLGLLHKKSAPIAQ